MPFSVFHPVQRAVGGEPVPILGKQPLRLPSPAALADKIAAVEQRAKQRTLGDEPALVARWLVAIGKAYRVASRCPAHIGVQIDARVHGGAVPNSYGYKAGGTTMTLTGGGTIEVVRGWAPHRPGGGGPTGRVALEAIGAPPMVRACLGITPGTASRTFVV